MSKSKSDPRRASSRPADVQTPTPRQPLPGQTDFLGDDSAELLAAGLADVAAGRVTDHAAVEAEFGAPAGPRWPNAIAFPLADLPVGYVTRHVDVQLKPHQAEALKRLTLGLDAAHARLANAKPVTTPAAAVQWLLEQIAGAG